MCRSGHHARPSSLALNHRGSSASRLAWQIAGRDQPARSVINVEASKTEVAMALWVGPFRHSAGISWVSLDMVFRLGIYRAKNRLASEMKQLTWIQELTSMSEKETEPGVGSSG